MVGVALPGVALAMREWREESHVSDRKRSYATSLFTSPHLLSYSLTQPTHRISSPTISSSFISSA